MQYQKVRPLKQCKKLEVIFWITFFIIEIILWDLDCGIPASLFKENEFDHREEPQQMESISAKENRSDSVCFYKVTFQTDELIHRDFDGRNAAGSFEKKVCMSNS